jgi:UTP--glucose-1-phosphate uridylyltransferase
VIILNKKSQKEIRKAVIPAAGLGTRFLPVTKSMPKEMLPIINKPVIHYVVEEAINAGIEDIIIITGRGKRAIEDYFDAAPELEMQLKTQNKIDALENIRKITDISSIHYIRQKEPKGLGDAILKAEKHIDDEPFAVLLGDDIIVNNESCMGQLIVKYSQLKSSIIAVERIPPEKISRYGIVKGTWIEPDLLKVQDIIEKPELDQAPSDLGSVGRYVFVPEIFDSLKHIVPGFGDEIQLTDAICSLVKSHPVYAYQFRGKRYDTGDTMGYIGAIIDFALKDPELCKGMRKYFDKTR